LKKSRYFYNFLTKFSARAGLVYSKGGNTGNYQRMCDLDSRVKPKKFQGTLNLGSTALTPGSENNRGDRLIKKNPGRPKQKYRKWGVLRIISILR
jgi:hypothetical protein